MRAWVMVRFVRLALALAPLFPSPVVAQIQTMPTDRVAPPAPIRELPPVPPAPPPPPAPPTPARVHVPWSLLVADDKGEAGVVLVRVNIAVSGAVTACTVVSGFNAVLDRGACAFLRNQIWPVEPLLPVRTRPVERWVQIVSVAPTAILATTFGGAIPIGLPWVRHDDYPQEAIAADEQGRVGIKFGISSAGRVVDCVVVTTSGSASLDAVTCRIMSERALFISPRDKKGRPYATTGQAHLIWKLEE